LIELHSVRQQPQTLIVEDDPRLSYVTSAILEDSGYSVVIVSNANDAIVQLETSTSIETVVTDICLGPGPTGIDLAREVSSRWPKTGVIVTSGNTILECTNLPEGCLFLPKPYRPAELLTLVASFHDNPTIVEDLRAI